MSDERGFTLVEMLVAATLFGLVMALATEGLRTALAGWRAAELRTGAHADVAAAQMAVGRLLAEAWPMVVRTESGELRLAFDGDAARVRLVAAVPPGSGRFSAVELRLDGGALVAVIAPIDPSSRTPFAALEQGTATVLLDGIAGGAFVYRDAGGRAASLWSDHRALPRLIRLRVAFPSGDARRWPELAVSSPAESPVTF